MRKLYKSLEYTSTDGVVLEDDDVELLGQYELTNVFVGANITPNGTTGKDVNVELTLTPSEDIFGHDTDGIFRLVNQGEFKVNFVPTKNTTFNVAINAQAQTLSTSDVISLNVVLELTEMRRVSALEFITDKLYTFITGIETSQTLEVSGGVAPYTFTVSDEGDALPSGITLSTDGILSGTNEELSPVSSSVKFDVTDSFGNLVTSEALTLDQVTTLDWTGDDKIYPVDVAMSWDIITDSIKMGYYGLEPLTVELINGVLPEGLTLTDGVLSGTPTVSGNCVITLQVSDSSYPTPQVVIGDVSIEIEPAE